VKAKVFLVLLNKEADRSIFTFTPPIMLFVSALTVYERFNNLISVHVPVSQISDKVHILLQR